MEKETPYLAVKVLYDKKDFIAGAQLANTYLVDDPDSIELQMLLGQGYLSLGLHEKALLSLKHAYNNVLHSDPLLPELYYMLGCAYSEQGDMDRAINNLKMSESLNPTDATVLRQLGFELFWDGDEETGLEKLKQANEQKAKDPDILGDLAVCSANAGYKEEAVQYANEAIDAGNDNMRVFLKKLTR